RLGPALAAHPDRDRRVDRPLGDAPARALSRSTAGHPKTTGWTQGDGSAEDRGWLADWRRQVSALYAEVRSMAATDPSIAHAHWPAVRERLFREHPQSPLPPEARAAFTAAHFPYDPMLRHEVPLQPAPPPAPGALGLELPNSGSDTLSFTRIGRIAI